MKALTSDEVGNYFSQHFVCSFQKVGNFRIVNGQKVGGNVASYFTLPDGTVLHALAGPVDAATLLREARWVVETRKSAIMESQGSDAKYKASWRKAHAERLAREHGVTMNFKPKTRNGLASSMPTAIDSMAVAGLKPQAQVHHLLANNPLVGIDKVYRVVFEKVLKQEISTAPVNEDSTPQ